MMHIYFLSIICIVTFFIYSTATISSSFPVELSISQEKRFLPSEIATYTQHVNIEIKSGPPTDTHAKLPHELYIILDSSGSMAGAEKWNNAVLAIENIIRNINKDDRLHLVHYNSYSSVVFENANDQQVMLKALHALYPSGGTNLMAGLNQVIPLLKKYSDRFTIKRLFIFSDGQINEGVVDHEMLLNEITTMKNKYDITICSFGIGYDFDEKLMTNIADHGSGDYLFIKGAESMEKVVGIAYRGFRNLMGTDAYLKLTTKYNVQILDIYGYETKQNDKQIIPIGNLRYNDMMNVLMETKVTITKELLEKNDIDHMIVELWMTDIVDRISKLVAAKTVVFSFSRNEEELKELNEIVLRLVELEKIQRRSEEVTKLLQKQRIDEAFKLSQSLANQMDTLNVELDNQNVRSEEDLKLNNFFKNKLNILSKRARSMLQSFSTSMSSEELVMQSSYRTRLNAKYSTSNDEL